jgi:hypothetical protein
MTERNDEHCCFICEQPFKAGDMVLQDVTEGLGHRACFGEDREGYVHLDTGNPLADGDPLPTGFPYDPAEFADPAPAERKVSSERVSEERLVERMEQAAKNVERHAAKQKCWPGDNDYEDAASLLREGAAALRSSVKTETPDRMSFDAGWAAAKEYFTRSLSAIEAPAAASEVTEEIRVPLHSLQADVGYLFGRVAADSSCASAMAASVRERLTQIETALAAALNGGRS